MSVALLWLDAIERRGPVTPSDGFGSESAVLCMFHGMASLDFSLLVYALL
jgi:hypothetical protein